MKILVFLFMLVNANLVFAGDGINYFPHYVEFCSSCIFKVSKQFTKKEFCNKKVNSKLCEDDTIRNSDIWRLDDFNDCVIKSYNSVIDKFKTRNIQVIEVNNVDEATVEWKRDEGYESDDIYRYTTCLGAPYGKYYIYKDKQEISKTEKKK